jgi:hypothetical protein
LEPIKIVREQLGNPQKNPSRALLPHIDFIKQIRGGVLAAAEFPATCCFGWAVTPMHPAR